MAITLKDYETEFAAWLLNARRRAAAVRAGKMSARVAEKRNAQHRDLVARMSEELLQQSIRDLVVLACTFTRAKKPLLRLCRRRILR